MNDITPNPGTRIALFQRKEVRRTIHNNEWWFVVADVVAALTDSVDPQGYIKDMRRRDPELAKGWGQIATPLSIATASGPQDLNCANTEGGTVAGNARRELEKKSGRRVVTSENYLALAQAAKKAHQLTAKKSCRGKP